jgi:hypothetical protein
MPPRSWVACLSYSDMHLGPRKAYSCFLTALTRILNQAAYFGANGVDFVRARQSTIRPPRLLYRVHNGRGAHTTIDYASMHDKTAVEQHPEQTWSDGRPKASPNNQRVVGSLTVVDDFAATTSTTSQFYKNPRHGANDEGYYSFRGFEEVTTTLEHLAESMDQAFGGLLEIPLDMASEARAVIEHAEQERSHPTALAG